MAVGPCGFSVACKPDLLTDLQTNPLSLLFSWVPPRARHVSKSSLAAIDRSFVLSVGAGGSENGFDALRRFPLLGLEHVRVNVCCDGKSTVP